MKKISKYFTVVKALKFIFCLAIVSAVVSLIGKSSELSIGFVIVSIVSLIFIGIFNKILKKHLRHIADAKILDNDLNLSVQQNTLYNKYGIYYKYKFYGKTSNQSMEKILNICEDFKQHAEDALKIPIDVLVEFVDVETALIYK